MFATETKQESDCYRSAPLRRRRSECVIPWPFPFESGPVNGIRIAYELVGPAGAPVIAVLGGISADRAVTDSPEGRHGWWSQLVSDHLAVDTTRYQILSFDYVGGKGASSSQEELPVSHEDYFKISTCDQATALAFLLEVLGIERLFAFVGASFGAMVGLAFAAYYPNQIDKLIAISGGDRSLPQAIAWRSVQRQIVQLGLRHGCPSGSLALARQLAVATYRTAAEFNQRFSAANTRLDDMDSVVSYLSHQGCKFAETFSPRAFLCLSGAIDEHQIDLAKVQVPVCLVGVKTDQLVPAHQIQEMAAQIAGPVQLHLLDSLYGHDAFLKEIKSLSKIISSSLGETHASI